MKPFKKKKAEIQAFIKSHGGSLFQSPSVEPNILVIADKKVVKVASLIKNGSMPIIKAKWLYDAGRHCRIMAEKGMPKALPPFEPSHILFAAAEDEEEINGNVDEYGDSYLRDLDEAELKKLLDGMTKDGRPRFTQQAFKEVSCPYPLLLRGLVFQLSICMS